MAGKNFSVWAPIKPTPRVQRGTNPAFVAAVLQMTSRNRPVAPTPNGVIVGYNTKRKNPAAK